MVLQWENPYFGMLGIFSLSYAVSVLFIDPFKFINFKCFSAAMQWVLFDCSIRVTVVLEMSQSWLLLLKFVTACFAI